MGKIALALMVAISIGAATTASSQSPQPGAVDPAWKVPEVIAFIGLKQGDKVADIVAGRRKRTLSPAVAPYGKRYSGEPPPAATCHPAKMGKVKARAPRSPN